MCRVKKVMAIVMASVLLVGGVLTAHATETVHREPVHVHAFSAVYSLLRSEHLGSHPYLAGWDTTKGTPTPIYGTCDVVKNHYKGESKCACGATNGTLAEETETIHSACGQ